MEIYENPSEHYAAVRQLRESDNERERWDDKIKILRSLICYNVQVPLLRQQLRYRQQPGEQRRHISWSTLRPCSCHRRPPSQLLWLRYVSSEIVRVREERIGSSAQDSLFPNSVQRAEPDINTRFLSSEI